MNDSPRRLLFVLVGLLLLTALTVGLAYLDLGPFNIVAALLIAAAKAALVMAYFMHLRRSGPFTRFVALGGVAWIALLIVFVLVEAGTRRPPAVRAPPGSPGISGMPEEGFPDWPEDRPSE